VIVERASTTAALGTIAAKGGTVRRTLKTAKAIAVDVPAGALTTLARTPGVRRISFDAPVQSLATPDWDARPLATIFPAVVGAPELWRSGTRGKGVGVAVLDSGTRDHEDFQTIESTTDSLTSNRLVRKVAVATSDQGSPVDDFGHGTWVAGIVGGRGFGNASGRSVGKYAGVAPDVSLVGVKVSNRDGVSRISDAIAGIEWSIENKDRYNLRVLNLSLASTVAESARTSLLDAAVELAWFKGLVVVVAAGNAGPNSMRFPPANDPYAIVVGATDPNDTVGTADDQIAWFSSYGRTQDGVVKPDLVAPGRRIVSALASRQSELAQLYPDRLIEGGKYIRLSGTSASAPVVSGVIALLLQGRPELRPNQVKWLLQRTAQPLPGPGTGAGYPRVDEAAAYTGPIDRANVGVPANMRLVYAYQARTGRTIGTESGWDESGWDESGWDESGWDESGWDESGWDESGWDESGWDASRFVESGWDTTSFATLERRVLGD
jgi:serine protease AprX